MTSYIVMTLAPAGKGMWHHHIKITEGGSSQESQSIPRKLEDIFTGWQELVSSWEGHFARGVVIADEVRQAENENDGETCESCETCVHYSNNYDDEPCIACESNRVGAIRFSHYKKSK
jgi:hypothetical protein